MLCNLHVSCSFFVSSAAKDIIRIITFLEDQFTPRDMFRGSNGSPVGALMNVQYHADGNPRLLTLNQISVEMLLR